MQTKITLQGLKPNNIFHLVNRASKALREDCREEEANELRERCLNENTRFTYDEVKAIVGEYVEFES